MLEFTFELGLVGWLMLIGGAIVIGVAAQLIGEAHLAYEWVITAVGAGVGALIASEFIVDMRQFEPVWDGLAIIPAIIGGLVVGAVLVVVTRYLTGMMSRPAAA